MVRHHIVRYRKFTNPQDLVPEYSNSFAILQMKEWPKESKKQLAISQLEYCSFFLDKFRQTANEVNPSLGKPSLNFDG